MTQEEENRHKATRGWGRRWANRRTFSLEQDKKTRRTTKIMIMIKIQISLWLFFNCKLKCWSCWFETNEIIITLQYKCLFHLSRNFFIFADRPLFLSFYRSPVPGIPLRTSFDTSSGSLSRQMQQRSKSSCPLIFERTHGTAADSPTGPAALSFSFSCSLSVSL